MTVLFSGSVAWHIYPSVNPEVVANPRTGRLAFGTRSGVGSRRMPLRDIDGSVH